MANPFAAFELLVNDEIMTAIPKRHKEKRFQKKKRIIISTFLKTPPMKRVYQIEL